MIEFQRKNPTTVAITKRVIYQEWIEALIQKGWMDSAQKVLTLAYQYAGKQEELKTFRTRLNYYEYDIQATKGNLDYCESHVNKMLTTDQWSNLSSFQKELHLLSVKIDYLKGDITDVISQTQYLLKKNVQNSNDTLLGITDWNQCWLTISLGDALNQKGKSKEALNTLNQTLQFILEHGGTNTLIHGITLNKLAEIYYDKSDYGYALELSNQSSKIIESTVGKFTLSNSNVLTTLGDAYMGLDEFQPAIYEYEEALTIRLQLLGEQHLLTAIAYNNLGVGYKKTGEIKKSR